MDTTTATEITIAVDMEHDLSFAGYDVERDGIDLDDMVARYTANAERIGAERGYTVTVIEGNQHGTRTPILGTDDDGHLVDTGETVETEIWQAAHDATTLVP